MMMDYKQLYLLHCANLNDCTTKEDVKRHNAAMKQLGKLFYQIQGELDKSFLLELLSNENDRTKALVSAHCLGCGVYVSEAKKVLSSLAKSKANPILAFEAQATLDVWKQQGYIKFGDNQGTVRNH